MRIYSRIFQGCLGPRIWNLTVQTEEWVSNGYSGIFLTSRPINHQIASHKPNGMGKTASLASMSLFLTSILFDYFISTITDDDIVE